MQSKTQRIFNFQSHSINEPPVENLQTSENFSDPEELYSSEGVQVYSVTDLSLAIKSQLEGGFPQIWVKGEISNFATPPSGHFYFSLKDSKSQIKAVMFKGFNSQLRFRPENGMEVIVRANVSTYMPRGDYQLICQQMDPVGQGALQAEFEQLKKKLQEEGLFDEDLKKPLPVFPQRIALVTSPTGAVIRDLLNVLRRRFKGLDITLVPTLVQGEAATPEIINAINLAHEVVPAFDIIVVARGGGSIEDLWCFNNEDVVRCIALSSIPIVSAVGHEVDFTLSDFVADKRAPTPSAAAELIVPDRLEVKATINHLESRIKSAMYSDLEKHQQKYLGLFKRLKDPQKQLQELFQRNDELLQRMQRTFQHQITFLREKYHSTHQRLNCINQVWEKEYQRVKVLFQNLIKYIDIFLTQKRASLKSQIELLDSLDPQKVVTRGYSIVKLSGEDGKIITSVDQIQIEDIVHLTFAKGKAEAQIKNIIK